MTRPERQTHRKTVLLVDDEQVFLEPLADALEHEGYRVLKSATVEHALELLEIEKIHLITIDVMIDPGESLLGETDSRRAGLYLCQIVRKKFPRIEVFCISVVSDADTINWIEKMGARFLRKGETPLRTVLEILSSRLRGIAYSTTTDRRGHYN
jgi:CheY-like chemotaxis protein